MKPYAIVPVKELDKAKSRLAECLSPGERKDLLFAMLDDVLLALRSLSVVVISPEDIGPQLKDKGVTFLLQEGGGDLDSAVKQAGTFALADGASSTLFVPADMPTITHEEVEDILRLGEEHSVVITHATDGGTGVLYRCPPDIIESRFTKNSFHDHMAEARKKGIPIYVYDSPLLSLDIDTLEDIHQFMRLGKGTRTYEFLSTCVLDNVT